MANTTNLDLVKPAGTDHALISVLNSNFDKIDNFAGQTNDSLSAEQNGLAYIVGNTNTTGGTLAVGQFVYVKGHSTIAEGLRKVTSSISANGSITTSNTDACSEGGLNALNSNLSTYITYEDYTISDPMLTVPANSEATRDFNVAKTGYTPLGIICRKNGDDGNNQSACFISAYFLTGNTLTVQFHNTINSQASINSTIRVLYVKAI